MGVNVGMGLKMGRSARQASSRLLVNINIRSQREYEFRVGLGWTGKEVMGEKQL